MSTPVTAAGVAKGRMCPLVVSGSHPERASVSGRSLQRGPALACARFGLRPGAARRRHTSALRLRISLGHEPVEIALVDALDRNDQNRGCGVELPNLLLMLLAKSPQFGTCPQLCPQAGFCALNNASTATRRAATVGRSRLTNGCAWNAVSAFANCGRAVAHVRGSYVP